MRPEMSGGDVLKGQYIHVIFVRHFFFTCVILTIVMSTSTFSSAENFAPLWNFLRTSSLDKITTSNVITQLWNCFKTQTEQEDFDSIMKILKETESEIIDKERKQHLKSLQN